MRKIVICFMILFFGFTQAQELNCSVTINVDKIPNTNQQVFKTLEKSLREFVNNTKWTSLNFKADEKIECSFFFTINTFNVDQFSGTLQVQSSRPVFNSTYMSPVLNINDKDVEFTYTEFQNLNYSSNAFDSNLVSLIAFYAHLIIGVDADTFTLEGGSKTLENAQNIVNIAQQGQAKGWSQAGGTQNRFSLINDIMSPTYSSFRKAMYEYHFKALDKMSDNQKEAKENIKGALKTLQEVNNVRPNAYITRVFFDAKADEILSIYTDGPKINVTDVIDVLNNISPTNSSKWGQISY
jgi:hypothetical protein